MLDGCLQSQKKNKLSLTKKKKSIIKLTSNKLFIAVI